MNCIPANVPGVRRAAVVVIGGGQSGLACSHYLSRFGVDHVVLERGEVAQAWRSQRWDSLRLLTPNWMSELPGWAYRGAVPDGFMMAREVAGFIQGFAAHCAAPVEERTEVLRVEAAAAGYRVCTDRGDWLCYSVIVASGAFGSAHVPALAAALPAAIRQLTTADYRNPAQLDPGGVLVVGAGASGVQVADELCRAGRRVTLAVGEHVRMPRSYRGRDIQYWMQRCGLLDETWEAVDDPQRVRRLPSPQLAGTPARRDFDLNALAEAGVEIVGRLAGIDGATAQFSGALPNVAKLADLKLQRLLQRIDEWIADHGCEAGEIERPPSTAVPADSRLAVNLAGGEFRTVIWATGYRPDYSWLQLPVLDAKGMPQHCGGVGALPGVYFMGLPFMRRRKSSFICGAGDDARDIVHQVLAHLGRPVENLMLA